MNRWLGLASCRCFLWCAIAEAAAVRFLGRDELWQNVQIRWKNSEKTQTGGAFDDNDVDCLASGPFYKTTVSHFVSSGSRIGEAAKRMVAE